LCWGFSGRKKSGRRQEKKTNVFRRAGDSLDTERQEKSGTGRKRRRMFSAESVILLTRSGRKKAAPAGKEDECFPQSR
jgi:hypothetical protein